VSAAERSRPLHRFHAVASGHRTSCSCRCISCLGIRSIPQFSA
jgi:hypothetical protein